MTLAAAVSAWLIHTITPYRSGASPQPAAFAGYIDPTPTGALRIAVAGGAVAKAGSVGVYVAPGSDVRVGDEFVHDGTRTFVAATDNGIQYVVTWVGPEMTHPLDTASSYRIVAADASRQRGAAL